jgi:hypothetical protein
MPAITQLTPYARPGQRYGSFADKEIQSIVLSAGFSSTFRKNFFTSIGRKNFFTVIGGIFMQIQSNVESYPKQPNEKKYLGWNFAPEIGSNTAISSVAVTLENLDTPAEDTSSMLSGSAQIGTATKVINYGFDWVQEASGTWCAQLVQGGTNEDRYKLTMKATDSTGQVHHAEVIIYINDN